MDIKWLEDLAALQAHGSYTRAAAARHVTHPAFGRRIRSLQAWVGVDLVEPGRSPVRLTPAGLHLLNQSQPMLQRLAQARSQAVALSGQALEASAQVLRVGTGRTLARTLVADWLARHRRVWAAQGALLLTRAMADSVALLEQGHIDLLVCYEHSALSVPLSSQRFAHLTLARDQLVPVARAAPRRPGAATERANLLAQGPWLGYSEGLALGRLLDDHLSRQDLASAQPLLRSDSADALAELVAKGLGLAWLPLSLVAAPLRQGQLMRLGQRSDAVPFEVRIYRPRRQLGAVAEAVWAATNRA